MGKYYTKKFIITSFLFTVAGIFGLIYAHRVFLAEKNISYDSPHPIVDTITKDDVTRVKPVVLDYEDSISKGEQYLLDNFDQVSSPIRLILDYLYRKFGINDRFSAQKEAIKASAEEKALDETEYLALERIAYPNKKVSELNRDITDIQTRMMMAAANCDHIPLTPNFNRLLERNIEMGGYNLTHVAFSLEMMQDNVCITDTEADRKLRNTTADGMVRIVNDLNVKPDLRYEAIAFLMYMGRHDLVQKAWVDEIKNDQQQDGSWKTDKTAHNPDDYDHTALLAIWAMLEYSRPNALNIPMIRN